MLNRYSILASSYDTGRNTYDNAFIMYQPGLAMSSGFDGYRPRLLYNVLYWPKELAQVPSQFTFCLVFHAAKDDDEDGANMNKKYSAKELKYPPMLSHTCEQLRYLLNVNNYIYFFGVQQSIGTCGNTVRPNHATEPCEVETSMRTVSELQIHIFPLPDTNIYGITTAVPMFMFLASTNPLDSYKYCATKLEGELSKMAASEVKLQIRLSPLAR